MLTPEESKKITDAFNLLERHGIFCSVPGWFDLSDAEDAVAFANNPEDFYNRRNPDYSRG